MTRQKKIRYEEASMELQMAPMIDVVFQLIIFFMCSIHFKSLEGKLMAQLPLNKGMVPGPASTPIDDVRIRLIYSENEPLLTKVKIGSTDFSDMNSLYAHLKNMEFITPDGDVIPVKIDADGKIPAQSVVSVLDICKRAGVPKTEFAAKTPIRSPPK